jgi:PAS domain-containing protein
MPFRRVLDAALGACIFAAAGLALLDCVLRGGTTWLTPWYFAAIAGLSVVGLYVTLLNARIRARALESNASNLQSMTERLEASLATLAAVNARLHESENRYRGLVGAQGDAIFRRTPDGRLSYGNDSFFRLFGLNPQHDIGQTFAADRKSTRLNSSHEQIGQLLPLDGGFSIIEMPDETFAIDCAERFKDRKSVV